MLVARNCPIFENWELNFSKMAAGSETISPFILKELVAENIHLLGRRERRISHVFLGLSLHALT